jgi:hypothetical protein
MGKRKLLNGIPNSLVQRYFSTLFYYNGAYMPDWIFAVAEYKKVSEFEIDILNNKVYPEELTILPLLVHLEKLRDQIVRDSIMHGFPGDFFVEAKFKIEIPQNLKVLKVVNCKCTMTDREGRRYEGKVYAERAYGEIDMEKDLNPITPESFIRQVFRSFLQLFKI